jgi:hypothetical protein
MVQKVLLFDLLLFNNTLKVITFVNDRIFHVENASTRLTTVYATQRQARSVFVSGLTYRLLGCHMLIVRYIFQKALMAETTGPAI